MRPLILGSAGMLGRAWRELLQSRRVPFDHADKGECDITDPASIARTLTPAHTHVVNAAAWTDVDGAESNEPAALSLNAHAVAHLADACARTGATLVHYSTDYVFSGQGTSPYPIDAPRQPLGAYGRTKLAGERALEDSRARWLCVRTSWLYAPWGKNFLRTIGAAALSRPQLKVVHDQRGRPTSAEHLARATLALLEARAAGMFHVADAGECTWFEFARFIVDELRASLPPGTPIADVVPCSTAEFPRPARRPAYSVLDLAKAQAIVGPWPDWHAHAHDALRRRAP